MSASLAYFGVEIRARAERSLDRYLGLQAAFFTAVDRIVVSRYCRDVPQKCGSVGNGPAQDVDSDALLDKSIGAMNDRYTEIETLMANATRRMEDERAHFWF